MANDKEMSEEDFLKKHLEDQENKSNFNPSKSMIDQISTKKATLTYKVICENCVVKE